MGFTLTAEPASETIKRGVLAVFLLEVKWVNGFAGNASIICTGGPAQSVCGDFPQTVRVKANGAALALSGILFRPQDAAGTYTITFTGVSGTDTSTATAQFTVKQCIVRSEISAQAGCNARLVLINADLSGN
jgi:hypothetical protein